jgi:hypothetical protein
MMLKSSNVFSVYSKFFEVIILKEVLWVNFNTSRQTGEVHFHYSVICITNHFTQNIAKYTKYAYNFALSL